MAMMNHMPAWKLRMAKTMAHKQTPPEQALWDALKDNQLGARFQKQKPMYGYIADFWCASAKLIVEADGKQHLKSAAVKYDHKRDRVMKDNGIKTMRFTAEEIRNNFAAVVCLIRAEVQKRK